MFFFSLIISERSDTLSLLVFPLCPLPYWQAYQVSSGILPGRSSLAFISLALPEAFGYHPKPILLQDGTAWVPLLWMLSSTWFPALSQITSFIPSLWNPKIFSFLVFPRLGIHQGKWEIWFLNFKSVSLWEMVKRRLLKHVTLHS